MIDYRMGDIWTPRLDVTEALSVEFQHYVALPRTGERPRTDGLAGLRVVQILEAASQSLQGRGKLVELKAQGGHGMIPYADLKAQYQQQSRRRSMAPSANVLESSAFILGKEVAAVRTGLRGILRRAARQWG